MMDGGRFTNLRIRRTETLFLDTVNPSWGIGTGTVIGYQMNLPFTKQAGLVRQIRAFDDAQLDTSATVDGLTLTTPTKAELGAYLLTLKDVRGKYLLKGMSLGLLYAPTTTTRWQRYFAFSTQVDPRKSYIVARENGLANRIALQFTYTELP